MVFPSRADPKVAIQSMSEQVVWGNGKTVNNKHEGHVVQCRTTKPSATALSIAPF